MDNPKAVSHLGLCAGYGGIELGLKRVIPNLRSVALCEIEAFACANLVAKMEAGLLDPVPIWSDVKTFPWGAFRGRVDILTGGYPCQPFSTAGKRLGGEDPRHLWPYISGGIRLLQPALCFFENVEGHITQGLHYVLSDLGKLGYRTTWGLFSASECGALTDGSGYSFWPTVQAADGGKIGCQPNYGQQCLSNHPAIVGQVTRDKLVKSGKPGQAAKANRSTDGSHQGLWPTPSAAVVNDGETLESWQARKQRNLEKHCNGNGMGTPLTIAVQHWQTPRQADPKGVDYQYDQGNHLKPRAMLPGQVKAWGTPRVTTNGGSPSPKCTGKGSRLEDQAATHWATPRAEHDSGRHNAKPDTLHSQMKTENGGKLNPRWVETLMGLPVGWTMPSCASPVTIEPTNFDSLETESCQLPPRSPSKH